jgi:hypothetical protein
MKSTGQKDEIGRFIAYGSRSQTHARVGMPLTNGTNQGLAKPNPNTIHLID